MRYGNLTFVEDAGVNKHKKRLWKMLCDCGKQTTVIASQVRQNRTKSCGCLRKKGNHKSHGKRDHPLYSTWCNIKARCYNTNHPQYKDYGGRGIFVCDRWKNNFELFLFDVGERPFIGATLDRFDNNKGYEPDNVRWANRVTQRRNSRNVSEVTIGNTTRLITDWCDIFGITFSSVKRRIDKGENVISALTRPKAKRFQ
jgi:hypothetical protein